VSAVLGGNALSVYAGLDPDTETDGKG